MAIDMKRVAECVFDITTVATYLMCGSPDWQDAGFSDSREFFNTIYSWALEFERENPDPVDYMTEIEMFAYRKLSEVGIYSGGGEE